jgi:hypothetical protein
MGDFNAQIDEYSIKDMLERDQQFVHLLRRKTFQPTSVLAQLTTSSFSQPGDC